MNIIFLDIDGVVATPLTVLAYPQNGKIWSIDPTLIKAVGQLAWDTDSKIVLSSTWRTHHNFCTWHDMMCAFQIGNTMYNESNPVAEGEPRSNEEPVWRTPDGKFSGFRGHEVKAWLDECIEKRHNVEHYVILDDDSDFLEEQQRFLVKTDGMIGLTYNDYRKARAILRGVEENDDND